MGGKGPPPKPTKLKMLQGNPGKRALNKDEPDPPTDQIKAPYWVTKKSRWAWNRIAPVLKQMGVLTNADVHSLALLCDAYAEYIQARDIVESRGFTYESQVIKAHTKRVVAATEEDEEKEGFDPLALSIIIRPRPEVAIMSDAWRRIRQMMLEFGLTPSARSRLTVGEGEKADPFEEWMKRGSESSS